MLTVEEGIALVRTSRLAIESHLLGRERDSSPLTAGLLETHGVFVTLLDYSHDRALRGCVGTPFPERPVIEEAMRVAVDAATVDPRFNPIPIDDLQDRIVVEVTVLTPPEELVVKNPLEYRARVVVGRDGLIVDSTGSRGLLLPQVAVDEGFDSEEFLSQCCMKAGLLPDEWLSGRMKVWRFQGQIFSEDSPRGKVSQRILRVRKT